MTNRAACSLAPVLLLTLTCRMAAPPPPSGGPRPRLQATAGRVVVLSMDGMAAERHRRLLAENAYGDPAGFTAFEQWGYVVERAQPVDPTLTAVSHAAIGSGAFPAVTGIVSNRFHLPGTPIGQGVSGFDAPWGAEPLWQAFRRQGKRVGVLTFPGCDGASGRRRADFGMTYVNGSFARAAMVALPAADFIRIDGALPAALVSFAPARRACLKVALAENGVETDAAFYLVALDTTDDGIVAYDTMLADDDGDLANGAGPAVHAREWFPLSVRLPHPDGGLRQVGAWCLLWSLPADLGEVRLYRGAFHSAEAYPRPFRERLEREAGFWPGPADDQALTAALKGQPGLPVADYLTQVRRFSAYFNDCARAAIAGEPFDLLMLYQPVVDEVQHVLTVADRRQLEYSTELAAIAGVAVDDTYRMADHAAGELSRLLDLSRDALVVVSDHGIAPVWETVHLNEVLRRAGLTTAEQGKRRQQAGADSAIVAVASGGCAHLYVNLAGREPNGVVPPARMDEVVRAAARALARLEVEGEPVVEAAYRREELAALGLDSPAAGDLVVFMRPGFGASSQIGGALSEPSEITGQHGFRSTHPEMAAVWMARGAAVPRARLGKASLTEVAAFVARLAGVQPPAQAQPWRRGR
ncbi:MAG: alkaline phosphatase family protein [Acidobacteriota bacterium]